MRVSVRRVIVGTAARLLEAAPDLLRALAWPSALFIALNILVTTEAPVWLMVIANLVSLLLQTIFAVTTHRIIVLGADAVPRWGINSWSTRETRFTLYALGLLLAVIIVTSFAVAIGPFGPLLLLPVLLVLGSSLVLVFPAAALDEPISLAQAWQLAQGNFLPLITVVWLVPTVCALPMVAVLLLGGAMFLLAPLQILVTVITVSALSIAYAEIKRAHAT